MATVSAKLEQLETARECMRFGARPPVVATVSRLPHRFVRCTIFEGAQAGRVGRPGYGDGWWERATLAALLEASVFAVDYRRLKAQGYPDARCLITAYRCYAKAVGHRPAFSFDQACYIASQLDGIWLARKATIELAACACCGTAYIAHCGEDIGNGCPACRLSPRGSETMEASRARSRGPVRSLREHDVPAELDRRIDALRLQQRLERLGAHRSTAAALLPGRGVDPSYGAANPYCRQQGWSFGPEGWSLAALSAFTRARYCLVALKAQRLADDGFQPGDAFVAAFEHAESLCTGYRPLSIRRALEATAALDGRWGRQAWRLEPVSCTDCGAVHLLLAGAADRPECPFCVATLTSGGRKPKTGESLPPRPVGAAPAARASSGHRSIHGRSLQGGIT